MKTRAKRAISRLGAGAILAVGSVAAFPGLAFASESEGGIGAILPTMTEFIPMLLGFLILWFILAKFGWPMFAGMLDKRETTIKEALEKSEAARVESEKLLEEHKKQLAESKALAAKIVADAKQTGEALKADLSEKSQKEAELIMSKAKAAIQSEKKTAIAELQSSMADISIDVASRVIGSDLSDDEHRKIVERYVSEAGNFNAN